jgi:hypothetical protein
MSVIYLFHQQQQEEEEEEEELYQRYAAGL